MYVYVLAAMDGWGCVCFCIPCSLPPFFLADLHAAISNVGGERHPVGWAGVWPTNFLVLPTFAMFSAH